MKVLVVSHSYAAAENQKNISALQRHADVRVAVPHFIDDRIIGRVVPGDVAVETYLVEKRISLPRNQYLLATTDFGLRQFQPDIVHIEYDPWTPIFWQALWAQSRHAPNARIVCTVKKNTLRQLPAPIQAAKERLARSLLRRVSHVIAVNEGVKRIYQKTFGVAADNITLMQHLGIDPTAFHPAQTEPERKQLIVGFCGRIDPHKGVLDLIDAFTVVNEQRPGLARLRMLGNGALRDELAARNLPWLEVLSPVPHAAVAGYMRGLDLFVMPALIKWDHEEHDAHALMEAMACGVATIGSTSGIIPELLGDNCGVIFPAGDKAALAERILALLDDHATRRGIARRGLARAIDSFTVDGIAERKAKVYAKVLET